MKDLKLEEFQGDTHCFFCKVEESPIEPLYVCHECGAAYCTACEGDICDYCKLCWDIHYDHEV